MSKKKQTKVNSRVLTTALLLSAMFTPAANAEYVPVTERQDVTTEGVIFDNNSFTGLGTSTTSGNGGAIYAEADLLVKDSLFDSNMANAGAAIYNMSGKTLTVSNTIFDGNKLNHGGVIYNDGGTVNITGGSFTNNEGLLESGNYLYGTSISNMAGGTVVVDGTTFTGNTNFMKDDGNPRGGRRNYSFFV